MSYKLIEAHEETVSRKILNLESNGIVSSIYLIPSFWVSSFWYLSSLESQIFDIISDLFRHMALFSPFGLVTNSVQGVRGTPHLHISTS